MARRSRPGPGRVEVGTFYSIEVTCSLMASLDARGIGLRGRWEWTRSISCPFWNPSLDTYYDFFHLTPSGDDGRWRRQWHARCWTIRLRNLLIRGRASSGDAWASGHPDRNETQWTAQWTPARELTRPGRRTGPGAVLSLQAVIRTGRRSMHSPGATAWESLRVPDEERTVAWREEAFFDRADLPCWTRSSSVSPDTS